MSDAPELKPCPFCGGEADISHDHTVEENHAYGCRKCDIWFDSFNSDNAIAAWNTRADLCDPMNDPRVKALVEAAADYLFWATQFENRNHADPLGKNGVVFISNKSAEAKEAMRAALAAYRAALKGGAV